MNRSLLRGLFVVAVVASFALPAVAQEGGPPFRVNTFRTNNQNFPAVSADAAGGFVVTWESNTQDDGFGVGVVARAFDASGAPRTGEVPVNVLIEGPQEKPAVAAVPDGGERRQLRAAAEGIGEHLQDLTPEQKARLQEQLERSAEAYAALTAEQKEVVLSNLADTIDRLRSRTPAQKGKPQGALPEAARAVIGP